jgi:hypothetical protein
MKRIIFSLAISLLFFSCKKDSTPNVTYSKVSITKLTVLGFPPSDANGLLWDNALNGNYPDIYFDITNSGSTTSLLSSSTVSLRYENVTQADLPKAWGGSGGAAFFELSNLSQAVDVDLYDYDYLTQDQYMGTCTFNFSSYTTGSNRYPSQATVTSGGLSIKLDLVWKQ